MLFSCKLVPVYARVILARVNKRGWGWGGGTRALFRRGAPAPPKTRLLRGGRSCRPPPPTSQTLTHTRKNRPWPLSMPDVARRSLWVDYFMEEIPLGKYIWKSKTVVGKYQDRACCRRNIFRSRNIVDEQISRPHLGSRKTDNIVRNVVISFRISIFVRFYLLGNKKGSRFKTTKCIMSHQSWYLLVLYGS